MIFHLSKIFKRKDKAIFLFLYFPSYFFLFSIFNLKMKTNMLKFICTSAKCKKKNKKKTLKHPQKGDFCFLEIKLILFSFE